MARVAAGAVRIGNTVGAAFTDRRALEPIEARIMAVAGVVFVALAALFLWEPRALAYPAALLLVWTSISVLLRAYELWRKRKHRPPSEA